MNVRMMVGLAIAALAGAGLSAASLDTHTVVLDATGKIVPWTSDPAAGYDQVIGLSWSLMLTRMPNDPANGLPVIYTHSEYDPNSLAGTSWPNNPAGKNAMLSDAAIMYYPYSGNPAVITLARGLLDFQLLHGTTPSNYNWPSVPWSTAAAGSVSYGNDSSREGSGVVEPDKVGELGYFGYLKFYEFSGNSSYLNAAIACADALASHVRAGDSTHSPWPFRVSGQTGATAQQEEYCADVVAPIRLFDELIRLNLGNTTAYQTARQMAWNWLMTYPIVNNVWANYFEDVQPSPNNLGNVNQYDPGETARYLLEHPELDANWLKHATNLLAFIQSNFGGTDHNEAGLEYGAQVISEQEAYPYKMGSHTSRYAADYALLYSRTGNSAYQEQAYRSFNWCTYMCRANGVVIEGPAEYAASPGCWFTDGHGDYIRNFMVGLGAVPEWGPPGQNHLTGSTTVIKSISYAADGSSLEYTTFDSASEETFRLAFAPVSVTVDGVSLSARSDLSQPGWVFTDATGVLRIRHDSGNDVVVSAKSSGSGPSITTASLPTATVNVSYSSSLAASGGTPPYAWSPAGGTLPPGLALGSDGTVRGTPTSKGFYNFTVLVSDASQPSQSATRSISLTVASALVSIAVTPTNPGANVGDSIRFTATGTYSDNTTADLSTQVAWSSSNPSVATVDTTGLAKASSVGTSTIKATLNNLSGSSALTVKVAPLLVTTAGLPAGSVGSLYAVGLTASGGVAPYQWSIKSGSVPAGLTLSSSGTLNGTPSVAGSFGFTVGLADSEQPAGSTSSNFTLVIAAVSTSFGNKTDGTSTDYLWSNGAWINACRFQANQDMTLTTLFAKVGAISGNYSCAVYSDSSSRPSRLLKSTASVKNAASGWQTFPLTSALQLSSGTYYWLAIWSDDSNARVYYSDSNGTLRWGQYNYGTWPDPISSSGGASLDYCIYATGGAPLSLSSIAVTPANPTILAGKMQQFTATGTYSDGSSQNLTSQVTWTSSNSSAATVDSSGLAHGAASGSTTISAALSGKSASTTLTVQAAASLRSVSVTPSNPSVLAGQTQQFTGTGTYSDGSTQNLTSQASWTSSKAAVATINSTALATCLAPGTTTVSATVSGVTGTTVLTVLPAGLAITTTACPNGTLNVSYSAALAASGGTTPYTWSITGGALPAGVTLNPSTGALSGQPTSAGTANFTATVSDAGSPQQVVNKSLSITINSSASSITVWPASTVPGGPDGGPDSAVELGFKFKSDVAGQITGIRFYKSSANTGTHVANLWSSSGSKLGSATFTGETGSGWQQVNFSSPVSISANTTYVASYHCSNGHYSADLNYFASRGVDNAPLHALANSVSADGVYHYGSSSGFPSQTWNSANYWVDVVFTPGS